MKRIPLLSLGMAGLIGLGACTTDTYNGSYYDDGTAPTQSRATTGAVTGAMLGGILGASSGGDERLTKTLAGAAVGGLIGGAIGSQLDKQAQELRRDLDTNGVSVVNTGSQLVVTMPQDVLFATDSAAVRPDLQRDLYTLAGSLNRYPNTTIEVIGQIGRASCRERV